MQDVLSYQWLEDSLKEGLKLPVEKYHLQISFEHPPISEYLTNSVENDTNIVDDYGSRRTKRTKASIIHSNVISSGIQNEEQTSVDKDVIKTEKPSSDPSAAEECRRDESGSQRGYSSDGTDSGDSKSNALVCGSNNSTDAVDKEVMLKPVDFMVL